MSEQVGILFKDGKATASFESELVTVEFDANLSEGHSWTAEITSNPVEVGADITDHIRNLPDQVTLVGFVTNTPFLQAAETGNNQTIDGGGEDRVDAVIGKLSDLKEKRSTLQVFTKYLVYTDMAIKSIDFTRDASNTNAIIFTIQFQKIAFANTQTVDVPAGISKKLDKKATPAVEKKTEPQKAGGAKSPIGETKPGSALLEIGPKAIQGAKDSAAAIFNLIKGF
jgi:hypothetical protein